MSDPGHNRFRVVLVRHVRVIDIDIPDNLESLEFDSINAALADVVTEAGEAKWVLDMSHVGYAGSALLGLLVNFRSKIRRAGGVLAICSINPQIERVLRTGSMESLFLIAQTRDDAINAL